MHEITDLLPGRSEICFLIKNAFSTAFCDTIIRDHKHDFQPANLNYPTSYRNNERQIKDDLAFSTLLFEAVKQYVPSVIEVHGMSEPEQGIWNLKGLNKRIRICRYTEGQYFSKHLDGVYYQTRWIQSKLTFMVYLNGGKKEFEGGRTLFFGSKVDTEILGYHEPSKGDLILFDHNLWHSGEEVRKGEKYILRSDILYQKRKEAHYEITEPFKEGHLGYIWKILGHDAGYFTAGRDKLIKVWDKNGKKLSELRGHQNSILDLALLSSDVLVSCSRDNSIRLWHKEEDGVFKESHRLVFPESVVLGVLPLSDRLFVSCGADGRLNLIDVNGKLIESVAAHKEWIWSIEGINEEVIASVGEDGQLKIWRVSPFVQVSEVQMKYPLTTVSYDKEHSILYIGDNNGTISGFEMKENFGVHKKFEQRCHSGKIWTIKCDKQRLVSGGEDNKVIVWEKKRMRKILAYQHKNFVQDLILEQDRIISVSYDGEIREWKW
ncbi:MAG: 2OG-Fe(II) oxygenase [Bacteroidota bacterium]